MRLGLISDTHGYFDPRIHEFFDGVDHILHAGDIGSGEILLQLEGIAPVTAVLGNNDYGIAGLECRETEVIEMEGVRILVHHIVEPRRALVSIGARFQSSAPHLVLFGHTHQVFDAVVDGVRFVNPGYAGRQRFSLERTLATVEIKSGGIEPIRFHRL